MLLAAFIFGAIFLLIASGGLLLFYREAMLERINAVVSPAPKKESLGTILGQTSTRLGSVVEQFERVVPKSMAEMSVIQQRLIRAGYREDSALKLFYGAKGCVPVLFGMAVAVTGLGSINPFIFYLMAIGLGYLAPDYWLSNRIKARQKKVGRGLPDVLDLMVICIEAGLSLDQATIRTSEELMIAQPALCDELKLVVLQQRAGLPRAEAWKQLAERTDVESIKNLVAVLVQSEKFGTSVAKTLRVHSETLRTQRRQKIEEQAAKTAVKLVFPLVFFIFPSLFLVTAGPAVISIMESFKTYFNT